MAATVRIMQWVDGNTANAVDCTGGTVRFKAANNATVDLSNPIVRPAAPSTYAYSCAKWLRLKCTVAPTGAGAITSPRVYGDGVPGLGTGVGLRIGTNATYAGSAAVTENAYAPNDGSPTYNFFTKTAGTPLALDNGMTSYTTTGDFANFVVLQANVSSTASPGLTSASEVATWGWDES